MNDTPPKIDEKMRELFQKKSAEERLLMGCSMYDFAKQLVVSSLLEDRPSLSPQTLRRELFLRFYGHEFDSRRRDKIMEHLLQHSQGLNR